MRAVISPDGRAYPYVGMGNANPDAVTQIATGYSTNSLSYDADGNVVQKTVDGTTTTYVYDYANRLIALGVGGATTTYGYDWAGNRVSQTGTTTTYLYPFKWYSVASSTGSGAKYATTTDYVFNGNTLLATVDQQMASGNATGTAKTRYVHPDHLGSTNVVTDENDAVVQTLDYYPYGATRISVGTSTRERRQFIGQSTDDSTLSYLNARYYDSVRGQFMSEEPIFLSIGDANQIKQLSQKDQPTYLTDPQALNPYSYGGDNPISQTDANGKQAVQFAGAVVGDFVGVGTQLYRDISTDQTSGVSTYLAAGLGGAANGAIITSGGYWYGPLGGFVGGGVQSGASQLANIANGTSNTFSPSDLVFNGLSQAPYGLIPGLRIKGITVGRNSFVAIGQSVFTRYDNGYINNIGFQSAAKAFTGSIVQNTPGTVAQAYMSVQGNTQSLISTLTSLVSVLQSIVQLLSKR
jgi:RHS repeat-associated protein